MFRLGSSGVFDSALWIDIVVSDTLTDVELPPSQSGTSFDLEGFCSILLEVGANSPKTSPTPVLEPRLLLLGPCEGSRIMLKPSEDVFCAGLSSFCRGLSRDSDFWALLSRRMSSNEEVLACSLFLPLWGKRSSRRSKDFLLSDFEAGVVRTSPKKSLLGLVFSEEDDFLAKSTSSEPPSQSGVLRFESSSVGATSKRTSS